MGNAYEEQEPFKGNYMLDNLTNKPKPIKLY